MTDEATTQWKIKLEAFHADFGTCLWRFGVRWGLVNSSAVSQDNIQWLRIRQAALQGFSLCPALSVNFSFSKTSLKIRCFIFLWKCLLLSTSE